MFSDVLGSASLALEAVGRGETQIEFESVLFSFFIFSINIDTDIFSFVGSGFELFVFNYDFIGISVGEPFSTVGLAVA